MRDLLRAIEVSRALDDRRSSDGVESALARVHALLSESASVPRARRPVTATLTLPRGVRTQGMARWAQRSLVTGLAASIVVVSGLGVWMRVSASRARESSPVLAINPGFLTDLPARSAPLARAGDEPLLREAVLLRADTRRAARVVLGAFPTRLRPANP